MRIIKQSMREKLVLAILDLAGDEYEDKESFIELCVSSEESLVDKLISIAQYYKAASME
jgi:hypothetical protein